MALIGHKGNQTANEIVLGEKKIEDKNKTKIKSYLYCAEGTKPYAILQYFPLLLKSNAIEPVAIPHGASGHRAQCLTLAAKLLRNDSCWGCQSSLGAWLLAAPHPAVESPVPCLCGQY